MTKDNDPFDVWLWFDGAEDETPEYEANTFRTDTGYRIEWYHVDVGLVTEVYFKNLKDVHDWYKDNNFIDYTA